MTIRIIPLSICAVLALPLLAIAAPSAAQSQWKIPPVANEDSIPDKAREEGVSGAATVSCEGSPEGAVINCRIENETPEGYGFGQSAMDILQSGSLNPSPEGLAIERFHVRIPFNVEEPAPLASPQWEIAPDPKVEDFPMRAIRHSRSGAAVVGCTASAQGVPENCTVLQEQPARYGFGEAAVKIVQRGRLKQGDWLPGARFSVLIPFSIY